MLNYMTKQKADELLIDLIRENSISLNDISNCAKQHKKEINSMMKIFDHSEDRDNQLALGLLGLIAKERANTVIEYYCKEFKLPNRFKELSKEDITLLFTSCLYNPSFYLFALSTCEDVKSMHNDMVIRDENILRQHADYDYVVLVAGKDNMLRIKLFTPSKEQQFKPSSRLLNIAEGEEYIRLAFQAKEIRDVLKNYYIEISKDGYSQVFPLPPPGEKNFLKANELIITVDVSTWRRSFEGTTIKFIEKPTEM